MREYGSGSDLQKVTQAIVGLREGDLGKALAGGASPYIAEKIASGVSVTSCVTSSLILSAVSQDTVVVHALARTCSTQIPVFSLIIEKSRWRKYCDKNHKVRQSIGEKVRNGELS